MAINDTTVQGCSAVANCSKPSEGREMIGYADYYFHWLLRFAVS